MPNELTHLQRLTHPIIAARRKAGESVEAIAKSIGMSRQQLTPHIRPGSTALSGSCDRLALLGLDEEALEMAAAMDREPLLAARIVELEATIERAHVELCNGGVPDGDDLVERVLLCVRGGDILGGVMGKQVAELELRPTIEEMQTYAIDYGKHTATLADEADMYDYPGSADEWLADRRKETTHD